ncbi:MULTISPECIES: FtsK/SpoIIIE domain-containing protein [unclassified Nocardiopsis]|uniref:FtsK/SpoIIIE domain-containing protein n=1 Tax=Nocardiopsis TaxID=2013 RepID=UPI00387B45EF
MTVHNPKDEGPRLVEIGGEVIRFPTRRRTSAEITPTPETNTDTQEQDQVGTATPATEVARRPTLKPNPIIPTTVHKAGDLVKRPDRIAAAVLKHELVHGPVGLARGAGALWRWMTAAELDQHLATKPELVLNTRKVRRQITGVAAGTLVGGGVAAWFLVGPGAVIVPVLLVLTVAGAFERRRTTTLTAEAGHGSLGASPSGKEVKRVFVSARLARRTEDVRIVGPVARTGDAWETTVELPPGTTYKAAAKRRGELAAAIGVDEVQVALDPVKGHNGRVKVWVADEDPMQGERVVNPLTLSRDPQVNVWSDKLFAGHDVRGRAVVFSMIERSYLIGGEPGGGKSVASNNVLAFFFLDPNVRVYLADGKFGFDLMVWENMAAGVLTERVPEAMVPFLEEVQQEMDRRYALLRKLGVPKITEDIAVKFGLHPIVVHVDEVQYWTAGPDKKVNERIMILVADIVGRGRAAGIITGVVTQRPAAEVVPSRLRDILSIRWALRCTTPAASDTVLGAGWAGRGYSAALFEPDQRGAGYLLAEGSSPVQTRAAFIDPAKGELQALANRAYQLRKEAGTLPASEDRPEIRLLTAMLDAMGHPKGAHTADLLACLAAASPEYAGWDAARLADAVKGLGLFPGQLDIGGKNRNGYKRERVQEALDRA